MTRLALALLLAIGAVASNVDDAAALLQTTNEHGPTSDGSALLADGDYGMEASSAGAAKPPVELAESAGSADIPALGGKKSLTTEIVNFKLWRVDDGLLRTFRTVNGSGFHLYGTKAWRTGRRGQATLFKAHGDKVGVISMSRRDALVRNTRELFAEETAKREKLLPVTYFIQSFTQACNGQKSNGAEPGTGALLYAFARVSKAPVADSWTVDRMVCDAETAANKPHYKLAYSLGHHGVDSAFEAVNPLAGVVAAVDAEKKAVKGNEDWAVARRVNAWLTKGEDPALFSAAVMITQMPQTPVTP